jgi:hypothetical protein
MLMTALETMIEQGPRPDDVKAWVDDLISQTRQADLDSAQKASLLGSLEDLKRESVGQAGRRVIVALGAAPTRASQPRPSSPSAMRYAAPLSMDTFPVLVESRSAG